MKQFQAAARQSSGGEEILQFEIPVSEDGDLEAFTVRLPSTGQISLVVASMDEGGVEMLASVYNFMRGLMEEDDYKRFRRLVADGTVSLELLVGGDELNEQGIIEWIIEQTASRPTKAPSDYLPSQKTGGQRSTGRSPGKGSTRSPSALASS